MLFFFTRDFPIKNFYKGFTFKMNQILIKDFPLKFTRDFLIKKNYKGIPFKMNLDQKKRERRKERKKERKKTPGSLARAVLEFHPS